MFVTTYHPYLNTLQPTIRNAHNEAITSIRDPNERHRTKTLFTHPPIYTSNWGWSSNPTLRPRIHPLTRNVMFFSPSSAAKLCFWVMCRGHDVDHEHINIDSFKRLEKQTRPLKRNAHVFCTVAQQKKQTIYYLPLVSCCFHRWTKYVHVQLQWPRLLF